MTNTKLNNELQNQNFNKEVLENLNISWNISSQNLSEESLTFLNHVLIPEFNEKMIEHLYLSKGEFSINFYID